MQNIRWDDARGTWIEPFLGSGVVLFNVNPKRAVLSDTNEHIIHLYKSIQNGEITGRTMRAYLEKEGATLAEKGESHYYYIRDRFNAEKSPYDFLFLNRSCFNGVMRFNKKGGFNVPFCRKPERFRPALVTKICNQIDKISSVMYGKDWTFLVQDWRLTLARAAEHDFVYLDPPYIGRHTDYFNQWSEQDAVDLAAKAKSLPCGFALSMWGRNVYRENTHLEAYWGGLERRSFNHFYHVGSTENLRNEMEEVLMIKPGYAAEPAPAAPDQRRRLAPEDKRA